MSYTPVELCWMEKEDIQNWKIGMHKSHEEGKAKWFGGRLQIGHFSSLRRFGCSGASKEKGQGRLWRVLNFRFRSLKFILKKPGSHGACLSL